MSEEVVNPWLPGDLLRTYSAVLMRYRPSWDADNHISTLRMEEGDLGIVIQIDPDVTTWAYVLSRDRLGWIPNYCGSVVKMTGEESQ